MHLLAPVVLVRDFHFSNLYGLNLVDRTCDAGYTLYHGDCQCYKADNTFLSYFDASDKCVADGGHLAFIKSADQNAFLLDLCKKNGVGRDGEPWIGLRCNDTVRANCKWLDGSSLTYDNFISSELTSFFMKERLGEPDGGSYEVYMCSEGYPECPEGYWATPVNPGGDGPVLCQKRKRHLYHV